MDLPLPSFGYINQSKTSSIRLNRRRRGHLRIAVLSIKENFNKVKWSKNEHRTSNIERRMKDKKVW